MTDAPERVELLRAWRAEGLSLRECGRRLGISKNAVAGFCHRHQIEGPPAQAVRLEAALAALERKRERTRLAMAKARAAAPKPIVERRPEPAPPPRLDLQRAAIVPVRGCQYPIGQPARVGFYFCGDPVAPGAPYCPDHVRLCWQRLPRREAAA